MFLFFTSFSLRRYLAPPIARAISLRQTVIFLCSWFLLSDAGRLQFQARPYCSHAQNCTWATIAIALLSKRPLVPVSLVHLLGPAYRDASRYMPKTVLLCCIAVWRSFLYHGLLGFIPLDQEAGFHWSTAILGDLSDCGGSWNSHGGISSYARSVYAPLIPEGSGSSFLCTIRSNGQRSSAFGPALVGWIVDHRRKHTAWRSFS